MTSFGVKRGDEFRVGVEDDDTDDDVDNNIDGFILLVGVLGMEPLFKTPVIGRELVLNDVERVNMRLVPFALRMLLFINATRRFGGGDGGGNGTPGISALPYREAVDIS